MSFEVKIISGLFWGQLGMTGRALICFVVSILAARFLGAQQYGIYVAAASIVVLLSRFTEMGTKAIYNKYVPLYQESGLLGECSFVVRKIFFARMFLLVSASFILNNQADRFVSFVGEPGLKQYLTLITVWFLVRATMDCFLFIIWTEMKMKFYSAVEIGVSIGQLVGLLFLRWHGISVENLICLMIVVGFFQLFFYGRGAASVFVPEPTAVPMLPIVRFGLIIWLTTILQYFVGKSIDIFMILHYLRDSSQAAYYDIAHLLVYTGGLGLLDSITSLALPIFSEAHIRYGMDGLRRSWELLIKISVFVAVPPLFFAALHGESIIMALYGREYMQSAPLLVTFASLVIISLFLGSVATSVTLITLNREKLVLGLQGFNAVLNLVLNIILIPKIGVWGAVLATGGSQVITALITLLFGLKSMGAALPYGFFGRLICCLLVGGVATLWLEKPGVVELFSVAAAYWLLVTILVLRMYRFSEQEKDIMQSFQPAVYSFLSKVKLIR